MRQQWYYQENGQTRGPVSREELQRLINSGQLHNQSQVIRDGMRDWVTVSRMDSVNMAVQSPPEKLVASKTSPQSPPPRPNPATYQRPPTRPQRRSNRLPLYFGSLAVVAVLATLIGWLAHSFNSSDNNRKSAQVERQPNKPAASNAASQRATSKTAPAAGPVEQKHSTSDIDLTTDTARHPDGPQPQVNATNDEIGESVASVPSPASPNETTTRPKTVGEAPSESKPNLDKPSPTTELVASNPPTQTQDAAPQEKPSTLFQELDIQRQPTLSMLGTVMAQEIHYRILSELSVTPPDEKGFRKVQQVVKDTRLVKADALSRTMFEESLKRLIGWQFSYKLNVRNEVVEMRGPDDGKKVAPVEPAGAKGFLVTSVMDEDGWKELAELSFFTPDPKGMRNQSWSRQMTHNFEPLGSWFGETTFVPRGMEQGVQRFDYAHKMTYKPPEKAAAAAGGLPFTIKNADFKAGTAGGIIYFDTRLKRVQSAQEQFHVRGTLSADALGQVLNIPVEEKQAITVRIVDQNPWNNQPR